MKQHRKAIGIAMGGSVSKLPFCETIMHASFACSKRLNFTEIKKACIWVDI